MQCALGGIPARCGDAALQGRFLYSVSDRNIAMDGDRGIIEGLGCLKFDLPKTIANGDDVCQIRISRK